MSTYRTDHNTARKKKQRERRYAWINSFKENGCINCGEMEICCLDFHHVEEKRFAISSNALRPKEDLREEISRCVVLCKNCHAKVHAGVDRLDTGGTQLTVPRKHGEREPDGG